ncbi:unnamed protein product [Acidithrix sp. C25]|nr:unnamed protein product [Acidithrix sp. C25]
MNTHRHITKIYYLCFLGSFSLLKEQFFRFGLVGRLSID